MTEIEKLKSLVESYALESWESDRTCSREEDAKCDAEMKRIMSEIVALYEAKGAKK